MIKLLLFTITLLVFYVKTLTSADINSCIKNAVQKGIEFNRILPICRENIDNINVYSNSFEKENTNNIGSNFISTSKTEEIIHEMIKKGSLSEAGRLSARMESEKTKRIKARAEAEALRSPQIIATTTNNNDNLNTENNIRSVLTLSSNPIASIAAGSKILEITTPGIHGAIPGQYVAISNVNSSIDGIGASEINKTHVVSSVPSTTTFRITVLSSATAGSVSGGGTDVVVTFQN
tara:strand:+ start:60 stop:764 length:705 start_codon:yes stop_codon:yes gene_type:complete